MSKRLPILAPSDQAFVEFVRSECKRTGIRMDIRPGKYLINTDDGSQCTGYFDSTSKVLACALGRKGSIGTLAHEYCHLTQWEENCYEWDKADKTEAYQRWGEWLGDKIDPPQEVKGINRYLSIIRDLELDNEKRTVKIIKKHKLSVPVEIYTQAANAYVHFYNYLKISRRWCKANNSPYTNDVVRGAMSTKFNMNYKTLDPWIEKLFREQNI